MMSDDSVRLLKGNLLSVVTEHLSASYLRNFIIIVTVIDALQMPTWSLISKSVIVLSLRCLRCKTELGGVPYLIFQLHSCQHKGAGGSMKQESSTISKCLWQM